MTPERLLELHAQLCMAFTSPKRLEILNLLRGRELSVSELTRATGMRQPNLSQHLALLREKGMVKTRREGVIIYYSLANPKIMEAFDIVTEVLLEKLGDTDRPSKDTKQTTQ
ncbi:MAG: putative HTH-type transcriptional regulator [Syntrophorhabdaceae bacterium PtaU1.Bin034]|jgi:ArsR family transcriptional regulator|nr:MAG: putative HTH-type transcriptional regulator [Syntrophorhabdaceae bacterium PtaU1.Bin034]